MKLKRTKKHTQVSWVSCNAYSIEQKATSKWQICAEHAPRPKAEKKNIQWYYRVRMLKLLLASGWCRSHRQMFYVCDLQSRRVRKTARLGPPVFGRSMGWGACLNRRGQSPTRGKSCSVMVAIRFRQNEMAVLRSVCPCHDCCCRMNCCWLEVQGVQRDWVVQSRPH
jgi:hypothetical protein